jgi:trans-aconitate methyltransferase
MMIVLGRFFIISNRATSIKNFGFFKKTLIRMSSSDNSNVKKDPWSPENYARHANFVPKLPGNDLITSLLLPEQHECILDVGCGDGVLTFQIQERCSQCIGVDKSKKMIQVAGQVNNCKDVRVVDAEKLNDWIEENGFMNYFDAVFSNAGM